MNTRIGNGLSFAKRIYLPRTIGALLCLLTVYAAVEPLHPSLWLMLGLWGNGLIWPHLAYFWSSRARQPYTAECRNLLVDSVFCGFWVAAMAFNTLPAVSLLAMVAMNNVAAGGKRLLGLGGVAMVAGVAVGWLLLDPGWQPIASTAQMLACLPMLTLYPLSVGWVCYRLAMTLAEHKRTLRALGRVDSLTGLLNHGAWKDVLHLRFHECRTRAARDVVAIIDIDHFKQINDTYGHSVGDSVLRKLGNDLQAQLRDNDLAGRYGGDEFCVILPNLDLHAATAVMERLRHTFAEWRHPDIEALRVSLSIGLASFRVDFDAPSSWLDEADKALYVAKNTGRDRINACAGDVLEL